MSRTYKDINVINSEHSNKKFKKESNKKLRKKVKNQIKSNQFDNLNDSLKEVSNIWNSNKEWKKYAIN